MPQTCAVAVRARLRVACSSQRGTNDMSMKKAVLIALALAAGSGAQAQDRVRVVNEGGIRGDWTLAPGTQLSAPGYPGAFAKTGDDVCVAVGYRIQPDGSTSDFSLLKTWSSRSGEGEAVEGYWDAFSQAAVAALQQWKFAPAARGRQAHLGGHGGDDDLYRPAVRRCGHPAWQMQDRRPGRLPGAGEGGHGQAQRPEPAPDRKQLPPADAQRHGPYAAQLTQGPASRSGRGARHDRNRYRQPTEGVGR